MSNNEVLFIGDDTIKVEPYKFNRKGLMEDEFIDLFNQYPSIGFNSFQRLYAALRMFGLSEANKPWKPKRWNWMDYRIETRREKAGMGAVYGLEKEVDQMMGYIDKSCYDSDMRGRFLMLLGPVGSAKTSLIDIMSDTLDAYANYPQGEIYTIKFNLDDVSEHFGDLSEITCPAHENPFNFIEHKKLEGILRSVNESKPNWQRIKPTMTRCPSCSYVITKLEDLGEDWKERISFINLKPVSEVKSYEFRPTAEKAYNPAQIFGGVTNFKRMANFGGDNENPMVLNFGIGGTIDGPSPQRHITHFSEMYKGGPEFLNEMLDVVQKRTLSIKGKYEVYVDSVFIGTTNLQEYGNLQNMPEIGDYIKTRSIGIPVGYILVLDDVTSAFNKRIFDKEREKVHIPPHFVEKFLSPLSVLATLEEPSSKLKTSLLEKALIYNGEMPHGREYNFEEKLKQLLTESHDKSPLERIEGIKNGIPFRWFQNLPLELEDAIRKIPDNTRSEWYDSESPNGCIAMIRFEDVITSYIKRYDGINNETKQRIFEQIIPLCIQPNNKDSLFISAQVRDVNRALLGDANIVKLASKYLVQAYADANEKKEYLDARGITQKIDYEFLDEIEKSAGVVNAGDFRKDLANNVKYRSKDLKKNDDKGTLYDQLAGSLIQENTTFRRAIENYSIENILPKEVTDVSTAYSSANNDLVSSLKMMGYCKACANRAIGYASQLRKVKK